MWVAAARDIYYMSNLTNGLDSGMVQMFSIVTPFSSRFFSLLTRASRCGASVCVLSSQHVDQRLPSAPWKCYFFELPKGGNVNTLFTTFSLVISLIILYDLVLYLLVFRNKFLFVYTFFHYNNVFVINKLQCYVLVGMLTFV